MFPDSCQSKSLSLKKGALSPFSVTLNFLSISGSTYTKFGILRCITVFQAI